MAKLQKKKPKNKKIKSPWINEKRVEESVLPQVPYSRDIPVHDLFEEYDINTDLGLDECLYDLIHYIENGYYSQWEAVIRNEQGLPLTKLQKEALDELINFTDSGMS
jgi:hypothetical protein